MWKLFDPKINFIFLIVSLFKRKETLPVSKIQSVKAVRKGLRDIPRAFEIFTGDQTYVLKAKDQQNVEQWVQCLQIAVARSQKKESLYQSPDTDLHQR